MASCEMCGSEGKLFNVLIEGVELTVCKKCSSFGKLIKRPVKRNQKGKNKPTKKPEREIIQVIKEDFGILIREKRERMGLKQKEFAKYLTEKESLVHKIESGSYIPSLELARKLERQLGLQLVETKEIESKKLKAESGKFTIGDILKIK